MALSITHQFVSLIADGGDTSVVQPSNWNATHSIAGLGANVETFLGTPSSANLRAALTDETGGGAAVFADTPTLVTPVLGVASATSIQLGTVSSVTGQLKLANSASGNLTTIQAGNAAAARTYTWPTNFGAAGTSLTDAAGDGTLSWSAPSAGLTIGSSAIASGTTLRLLYDNAGTLGETAGVTFAGTGQLAVVNGGPTTTFGVNVLAGGSSGSFDFAYDPTGSLRFGGLTGGSFSDGCAFQGFGGQHASLPGQMYFDYGSFVRDIAGRAAVFRSCDNGAGIVTVWKMDASGAFLAGSDNSFDIGAAGANRPRDIYAGTSVRTPALRIDQTPSAVGTGTKTISNAADSSTNFGHYFSINMNGATYYVPCGATAPT